MLFPSEHGKGDNANEDCSEILKLSDVFVDMSQISEKTEMLSETEAEVDKKTIRIPLY